MSREVRRVPVDFDSPLDGTWDGYLMPQRLHAVTCTHCGGTAYSPYARMLYDKWHGIAPFDPAESGREPYTPEIPEIRAQAERHIASSPHFYGVGEWSIVREAERLCRLFNGKWMHHLGQEDVDALVEDEQIFDELTHTWVQGEGWQPLASAPALTAEVVNRWLLGRYRSVSEYSVIKAACRRAGEEVHCGACNGHGDCEAYPGQRAEADAWTPTEPPTGDGYQLWQTVSEGGPVSPVFTTPAGLADWIRAYGTEFDGCNTSRDALIRWIEVEGCSTGSGVIINGQGMSGVEHAATVSTLDIKESAS